MSKQRTVKATKNNCVDEKSSDDQENTQSSCFTTKLERRRRIEDLNEEKRLREELNVF